MKLTPSMTRMCSVVVLTSLLTSTVQAQEQVPLLEQRPSTDGTGTSRPVAPAIRDVRLESRGRLQMSIINQFGLAEACVMVQCVHERKVIAQARTDKSGRVTISGLRPGIHTVVSGGQVTVLRLWNTATAPPSAVSAPAIVADSATLRGQYGYGTPMIAPGLLATGVTAAAVVAILASKSGGSSKSAAPASP